MNEVASSLTRSQLLLQTLLGYCTSFTEETLKSWNITIQTIYRFLQQNVTDLSQLQMMR
jgi:hypothetical protein